MPRFASGVVIAAATIAAACARAAAPADADAVRALIQRQSQAFSDASASGDRAVLARYLDDRVIFVNEGGEVATKADIVDGAGPPPAGVHNELRQVDFHVELHGDDTAVTSFKDLSTFSFHGQVLHAAYLSTEVWHRDGDAWRMVSSQTLALPDDPPAAALAPALLDEYVGTYAAAPDYAIRVTRDGDRLLAAVDGGPPVAMRAELRDVFFVPGAPRLRRIFQRDAQGRVTGFVSRREGHDIVLRRMPS
jgi:ketosteroid isomerase-like protein